MDTGIKIVNESKPEMLGAIKDLANAVVSVANSNKELALSIRQIAESLSVNNIHIEGCIIGDGLDIPKAKKRVKRSE